MPFDGITIHALTDEIKDIIIGSRVDKIHQPENDEIIIHVRRDRKNYKLLLSADSNLPHFGLTDLKKENPVTAPMFCMLLRKHLSGGVVLNIEQLELERVIIITIESRTELGDLTKKRLIFEIMGKHSNITLVDDDTKIIDCIKRIALGVNRYRQLFPGITYLYPPNDKKDPRTITEDVFLSDFKDVEVKPLFKHIYMTYQGISPVIAKEICLSAHLDFTLTTTDVSEEDRKALFKAFDEFFTMVNNKGYHHQVIYQTNHALKDLTVVDLTPYQSDAFYIQSFDSAVEVVNEYYANKNTVNKLLQRSHSLRKSVQGKIDRLNKKIKNLKEDLLLAEGADKFKIKGELVLSNIYRIEKGMRSVELENYYDNNKPITIQLDFRLSPADNAQRFFKKYNKLKTAQIKVQEQVDQTNHEIAYLEHVLVNIIQSPDQQNIEDIKEEMIQTGYLKRKQKTQKKKRLKSKPYHYTSSDGFEILVGKNNLQNDELTLKQSSKSDYWFHTKNIPGSHVIIKCYGKEPSDTAIKEAGMIAAFHSKAKESSQVPVDYTKIRNVKKPNGSKPGMVIYSTNHTLYVTPVASEVEQLKSTN